MSSAIRFLALLFVMLWVPGGLASTRDVATEWRRLPDLVRDVPSRHRWLSPTRLMFLSGADGDAEWRIANVATGVTVPAFDHARMLEALRAAGETELKRDTLTSFEPWLEPQGRIQLLIAGRAGRTLWACTTNSAYHCRAAGPTAPLGSVLSPDRRLWAFVQGHDLWLMAVRTGKRTRLTYDGSADQPYATMADAVSKPIESVLRGHVEDARVLWSPDSRRVLTYRLDQRDVLPMPLIDYAPTGEAGVRPQVYASRVHFPGDAKVATAKLLIFDAADGARREIEGPPLLLAYEPLTVSDAGSWRYRTRLAWWRADSAAVHFVREARGFLAYDVMEANAATGGTTRLLREESPDGRFIQPALRRYPPEVHMIDGGRHIVAFNQRSGWGHFYFHPRDRSHSPEQLTRGDWNVDSLLHVDAAGRTISFSGIGREAGHDPYYRQLYRMALTDRRVRLVTDPNYDHDVVVSPDGRYIADIRSNPSTPPELHILTGDGRPVMTVQKADATAYLAAGWSLPERVRMKARDGRTDIYGVLYRPRYFDPGRRYPIIDYVYGSQSFTHAWPHFGIRSAQVMTGAGFAMVTIDGMGTPLRSRAFHLAETYQEAAGIADHPGAIAQLARRYAFIDPDRVGIYGCSAGGFGAVEGMLRFPDTYDVGVAAAGNYDQRLYNLQVGERYIGLPDQAPEAYAGQASVGRASRLSGPLLLIHGMLDEVVNPVSTMQLVKSFHDADKHVDMLLMPRDGHCDQSDVYWRAVIRYFSRHLGGDS